MPVFLVVAFLVVVFLAVVFFFVDDFAFDLVAADDFEAAVFFFAPRFGLLNAFSQPSENFWVDPVRTIVTAGSSFKSNSRDQTTQRAGHTRHVHAAKG